ncbi:Secretory lipase [Nocardia farcinica]|uniref:Secretory lipase n=2 Tax=Nocardia TaxID=1817 RepID=A0A0H5P1K8_NOCFR|nr:lipase family protein [Nocardia farcinica]AXK87299.1 lipase [Nocardia farcinica]MBA4857862.1 lipase [Nocardia farcinica]MBC9819060.1 lipase [Nocardia farcinica]CRY81418.1 Secretory lipase [Nocardia farcinica]SIT13155.1 Secretory lipase [Nocardia farcinica]
MGWKTITAALAGAALTMSAAGAAVAEPLPPRTPGLNEVFNGYVVGALQGATAASPDEILRGLRADDPFYEEPPLTGAEQPGTVLKSKKVDVLFTGVKPANLDAYKLMYVTTGLDGVTPIISTGILMIPVDGQPVGEKHLISYQEANDSVGPSCHPSTQWTGGAPMDGASWSALGPLALMFGKGHAVMISDVGNDADRDPHGVFAGKFAARAQLDGARAALNFTEGGLNPDAQVALFGIAGGGVGAAFAAELQPTYAPDLDVKSTVLEGMVVNPRNFMRVADGSVGSGFAFATLLGLEPWYPEMELDAKLNPAGKAVADYYRTQCQTPAYFTLPFLPLNTLFTSGVHPADEPAFQHVFEDNVLGRSGTPGAPVLIASCAADDSFMSLVPARDARELADTYRAAGADVTYAPTDCSMVTMLTNLYQWGTDLFGMQTIDWLDSRFE